MPFLDVKQGRRGADNGKGKKLTPKMIEFIDIYMIEKNATKAIELSSYKTKNPGMLAAQLMQHPLVQEEIKRRFDLRSEKAEVTAEYLIQKLLTIISETERDSDRLRAIELAGKSIALWKERQEISGPDGAAIQHEQHVKESVADFTSRISSLAQRNGTDNVVEFPQRNGASGT